MYLEEQNFGTIPDSLLELQDELKKKITLINL